MPAATSATMSASASASEVASASSAQPSGSLVSVTNSGALANGPAAGVSPSADGRYVAFGSSATNLVSGDTNGVIDVFVRDRTAATTTRVSVASSGTQANAGSDLRAMSSDGRYVIFESTASNLVSTDSNGVGDVFVRDRNTGTTQRASISASGGQLNAVSSFAGTSKNGRFIAFYTNATNVGVTTQAPANIYVRDLTLNTTSGFFYGLNPQTAPDGSAGPVRFSDDGRYVSFLSFATNITQTRDWSSCGQTGNGRPLQYLRDTTTGVNTFLQDSQKLGSYNGEDMTPDGRYVFYGISCVNTNLANDGGFYRYDRQTGTYSVVTYPHAAGFDLSVVLVSGASDDGQRVFTRMCFPSLGWGSCAPDRTAIRDIPSLLWVPVTSIGDTGIIEGDGKNVALVTDTALASTDTNGYSDVYLVAGPPAAQVIPTGGSVAPAEELGGCACGHSSHAQATSYPVDTASGNFWHTFDDLAVPGRGPALALTRTYNSLAATSDGPFGFGWSSSYAMSLTSGPSTTVVTQENGSQTTFTLNGTTWSGPPRLLATLAHNPDGTWTFTRRARETFTFDTSGRLTAVRDLNGYTTTVTYPSGSSQIVTDPAGRSLTFTYTGSHVTQVTDSATPTRSLTYTYDGAGNLTDVVDIGGGHWQFTYDGAHRMLTMRTPRFYGDTTTTPSPVVTNHYDPQGRVDWQSDPLGRTTSFDYTSIAGSTKVTDPKGNISLFTYNYGVLIAITRGWGTNSQALWQYRHDVDTVGANLVVDPNGHSSSTVYDTAGNVISRTDGLNRTTIYTYNALNEPTSITEPKQVNGHLITTVMTYDTAGNPLTRSSPLLDSNGNTTATSTTTNHYNDAAHPGDLTSVTDANNNTTAFTYDAFGNLTSVTAPPTPENPAGNKSTFSYDTATGRRLTMVSAKGNVTGANPAVYTTTYAYDAYGRPTVTKDPLWTAAAPTQHQIVRHYDADGNLDSATDGNNQTETYVHDAAGQLIETHRADGTILRQDYWADGTLNHRYDGAGQPTTYTYDPLGHPETVTDPLGRTTQFSYDPVGNQLVLWDPSTRATTSSYDAANQRTAITFSDGVTPNVTNITYDADGQRTAMSDGTGTSTWAWDSLHRLTSQTNGAGKTVGYGYDIGGRLSSITYPGTTGTVTRTYDAANRLATVKDWGNRQTTFGYDPDSNLTTQTYPNSTTSTQTFDAAGQLMGISAAPTANPNTPFASFGYGRDGTGQLTSATSTGVPADNHTWSYTELNQLSGVDTATYDYDAGDNLTKRLDGTIQSFDAANELLAATNGPPIALVGTPTGAGDSTSTSLTVNLPTGTTVDDQVLLAVTVPNSKSVTAPTGYAVVGTYTSGTSNTAAKVVVLRHTVTSGETSVTVSFGTKFAKSVTLAVYRNVNPAAPIDAAGQGGATNVGTSVTAPAVTASGTGDRLVMIAGANGTSGTWTTPNGMTSLVQKTGGTTDSFLAEQTLTAPGTTPSATANHSTSTQLAGVLVALRPAQTVYTYDPQGNRTTTTPASGTTTALNYDQANRLKSYGTGATYSYNGAGLRMSKTVSGTTTQFTWGDAEGLPLLLVDGTTNYIYGPGGLPLEQITSAGAVTYYHHDQLGSTRVLTNSSGQVVATYTYDPYGKVTGSTGTASNPFAYAGEYTDSESGLQYLRTRYYDSATGQFLTVDPWFEVTRERYSYVGGDPLNAVDPTGLVRIPGTNWCIDIFDPNCRSLSEQHPAIEPVLWIVASAGLMVADVSAARSAGAPTPTRDLEMVLDDDEAIFVPELVEESFADGAAVRTTGGDNLGRAGSCPSGPSRTGPAGPAKLGPTGPAGIGGGNTWNSGPGRGRLGGVGPVSPRSPDF